jgi:D-alanyl-D-alanine carboxypeptidase
VKRHKLKLDERLSRFYPWIPRAGSITIRMLLNHTSLIPDLAPSTVRRLEAHPATRFKPDQVIRAAVRQPYFKTPPLFNYSDTNYVLLGRIAERATHRHLSQLLNDLVLEPLHLRHTYFGPGTSVRGRHADGYLVLGGKRRDVTNWTTSYTWGAGAMVSTLGDVQRWAQDLVRGARLNSWLQRQRLQFITTPAGYDYGLGIMRLGAFCGHNGLIPGYDSTMLYSSQFHATIVILAGASPLLNDPPLASPFPPPPAVPDTLNLAVALAPIAFPQLQRASGFTLLRRRQPSNSVKRSRSSKQRPPISRRPRFPAISQ